MTPFPKNYAFNLLKEWLDDFDGVWKTLDFFEKECAIEFLKDVQPERSFPLLARYLLKENNQDFELQIVDVLRDSETLDKLDVIKDFFYETANSVLGRRFDLLVEVMSYIQYPVVLRTIFL